MRRRYRAFLSYSHKDAGFAKWLHRELERWRIDTDVVGRQTPVGDVPRSLRPIFRDRDDFAGGASLKSATEAALRDSDFLVVICSPNAAASIYVDAEVRLFKQMGRASRIIPIILAGAPDGEEECFPPSVKYELDEEGDLTDEPAEPIAADARDEGDGRHRAAAKVAAGLLGLTFDEIAKRAEKAQRQRSRIIAGVAGAMACLAVAAGYLAWLANDRRIEAEANYAAAKTAAGNLFQSVAQDFRDVGGVPLEVHRKILARADVIFDALSERAPDDLELVANQARTLGIFANSFRDQEDWLSMQETAERSEILLDRLISDGDATRNWRAYRATIRMTQLIAFQQLGESGSQRAKDLRRKSREDAAVLRAMAPDDDEAAASTVAAIIQDALRIQEVDGHAAAAERLDEALEFARSTQHPFVEEGQTTALANFVLIALATQAEFYQQAGSPNLAIVALERSIGVMADGLSELTDPIPHRAQMAIAFYAIEALAREQGDVFAAERAARFGQFADYGVVPWRNGDIDELRKQANLSLSNGEEVLRLEHLDVARGWFLGCAGMSERILEDSTATEADALQMLRCMEKVERTYPDDPERRLQTLQASLYETTRLLPRFPGLEWLGALSEGRMAELLVEQGDQEGAAAAFDLAGARLAALLPEKDAERSMVVAAGESFTRQAKTLQSLERPQQAIKAYQSAAEVYHAAHRADGGYGEQLTYVLHILAILGDSPTDHWRQIIHIVDGVRAPNEYMLNRRDNAAAKLAKIED